MPDKLKEQGINSFDNFAVIIPRDSQQDWANGDGIVKRHLLTLAEFNTPKIVAHF